MHMEMKKYEIVSHYFGEQPSHVGLNGQQTTEWDVLNAFPPIDQIKQACLDLYIVWAYLDLYIGPQQCAIPFILPSHFHCFRFMTKSNQLKKSFEFLKDS